MNRLKHEREEFLREIGREHFLREMGHSHSELERCYRYDEAEESPRKQLAMAQRRIALLTAEAKRLAALLDSRASVAIEAERLRKLCDERTRILAEAEQLLTLSMGRACSTGTSSYPLRPLRHDMALLDEGRSQALELLREAQDPAPGDGLDRSREQTASSDDALGLHPPGRVPLEPPDIFVWGIIDWHFRIQRPQHLSRVLAERGHRVFYFTSEFIDSEVPGFRLEVKHGGGLLKIVSLHVKGKPSIYAAAPTPETMTEIFMSLAEFLKWARPRSTVCLVQHPFWQPFADVMPNRRLLYDLMDHHDGFGDDAPDNMVLEQHLLRDADHVIVTSSVIEAVARARNASVSVLPNACEYHHFANAPQHRFEKPVGRRVIGYYGAIAQWFDTDLVAKVATRFASDLVLLIGRDSVGAREKLEKYPNIVFTGEVSYDDLPYYLHAFDVCLLPFKVSPLILATNPIKIYEYLSAGKPVVSVAISEIDRFEGLVGAAQGGAEFLDLVHAALTATADPRAVERRRTFASEHTWDHRGGALCATLATIKRPRASVIILTHNVLTLTDSCLHSLERNTQYENLEIIVVDNASTDGTQDYLRAWAARSSDRIVLLNDSNTGYAAANNQGLARATGEYLVLLNNDTYVSPGWLGTLVAHLRRVPDLGLVGPVTNSIGGEARIPIAYTSMAEMEIEANRYTSARLGQLYPVDTLGFFCVAMSRATFERIGTLDESFGLGMFEDDDYCRRVQACEMRIACAEDVFVHHHHAASFTNIDNQTRTELFERNKQIYEQRWGPWAPHRYRKAP